VKTAFSSGCAACCAEGLSPSGPLKIKLFWLSRLPESHRLSAQQAAEPLCRNRRFYTVSEAPPFRGPEQGFPQPLLPGRSGRGA